MDLINFITVIFSSVILRFIRFGCKFDKIVYLLFVWSYCLAVKTLCQPHLSGMKQIIISPESSEAKALEKVEDKSKVARAHTILDFPTFLLVSSIENS
ncbi:uncharacterized protein LOC133740156 isoform X2 [Rosa rugosa]|uniref:uncharacterized protein LOC133740156 isoform X2 n=1 Tax=Rosa rugosa TaxID=74645 RepID=UPI002B4047A1|nr:uncharacterized protein LOC133740156 isoform X2 [Rosa rugosa]